jgi:prepilin-type N-terminal cleavage/methylation domain-containing protein
VDKLNYWYRKHSKDGLTLLELFIVIALISIVSALLLKITFPSEEDLRRQDLEKALEFIIKMARKTANYEAKEMHVLFVDQFMPIKIDNKANTLFRRDQLNPNRQKSILDFLKATVTSPSQAWPTQDYSSNTKAPLFIVTDTKGEAIFDEDQVCYTILKNPGNGQLTSDHHTAFVEGYIDSDGKWKHKQRQTSPYFTVSPSGICDYVSFITEICQEYNNKYFIDPIRGTVRNTS